MLLQKLKIDDPVPGLLAAGWCLEFCEWCAYKVWKDSNVVTIGLAGGYIYLPTHLPNKAWGVGSRV